MLTDRITPEPASALTASKATSLQPLGDASAKPTTAQHSSEEVMHMEHTYGAHK